MDYKTDGTMHFLSLDKEELIMLIAILHEGLESSKKKAGEGSKLAEVKFESARYFINEFNKKIMQA